MDSEETPQNSLISAKNNPVPNNRPFPKGVSGNPLGRPKGIRNRSTVIKEFLEAKTTEKNPYTDENMTVLQKMTLSIIAKAMSGDVMAFNTIMDNCYGKLKDKIEVENTLDENNPLNLMKLEDLEEIAIVARRTRQPNRT